MVNKVSDANRRNLVTIKLPQAARDTIAELRDQLESNGRKVSDGRAVETALKFSQQALDEGIDIVEVISK